MCGISGYISKNNSFRQSDLKNINDKLIHRGPDEEGFYCLTNLGIGHKRLSIIDLLSGQQPMKNEDEDLILTYNGELYNYLDIKKDLIQKGYKFHTTSDTEVILKAYECYGNNCVKHFRGMFAFAIINKKKKEIFIARDHLGIKPLVYYDDSESFAWASEIQALKATPNFNKEIDYYAIDQYLKYQYIPAPRTIFRKIKKLLPGYYMVVGFDGKVINKVQYYDIQFNPKKKTEEQWINALEKTIKNSVKRHTVSDVDFGAFLSGGIDSTLVVKYMTEILGKGIKTYTIGFKDAEVNESHWAQKVADTYKTEHTSLTLDGNALEILPLLVKHYGEPFGDFSAIPTYYVSQLAAKDVKMVLSGDGADEIFAGYSHYAHWMKFIQGPRNKVNFNNSTMEKLYPIAQKVYPRKYPKLKMPADEFSQYIRLRTRMDNNHREKLWKANYRFLIDLPNEMELIYLDNYLNQNEFSRAQYFDIKVFMPSDILTKVDIASMMDSLEVRTPITDVDVYELAASIPPKLLLKEHNKSLQGKYIFKQLLSNDFDDDFIYRKKQGFEIPLDQWLFSGNNYELIKKRFSAPTGLLTQLFESSELNAILSEKRSYQVWQLLVLDEWFNQN